MTATIRPGLIGCACPAVLEPDDGFQDPIAAKGMLATAAAGFSATVLAQVLALSALPLAGAFVAPTPSQGGLPYAAMLGGGVTATLPAALLTDAFGRRAARALGASIGLAGGMLCAWSIVSLSLPMLVIGAFWLGIGQGFGFSFRHDALAVPSASRQRALAAIVGSGALAAVLAPWLLRQAEAFAAPVPFAGTLLAAGIVQALVLPLMARTNRQVSLEPRAAPFDVRRFATSTSIGAAGWLMMTLVMGAAPGILIGCGIEIRGVAQAVSWHVLAMYAPALMLAPTARWIGVRGFVALGLILLAIAIVLIILTPTQAGLALVVAGLGWSIATVAATARLHQSGPGTLALGVHDGIVLAAALAGALAAPWLGPAATALR